MATRERRSLYDVLLHRGVSAQEIDKVYRHLRERGYGEEEARRRSREAISRIRAARDLAERRRGPPAPALAAAAAADELPPTAGVDRAAEPSERRRASDWAMAVPGWLRRRINQWAFSRGCLVTRLRERIDDLLSLIDRGRPDFASRQFLRLLVSRRAGRSPFGFSFVETVEALQTNARFLLGRRDERRLADREHARAVEREVRASLQAREPFAIDFLGIFAEPQEMLRRSLEYLGAAFETGRRVQVAELARVVRDGCRLVFITRGVEPAKVEAVLAVARDVGLAHDSRSSAALEDAADVFSAAFDNLLRFGHELYPVLLKMIGAFYEEDDASPEKLARLLAFLGLCEDDLLTWQGWQRRREERLAEERRQRALEEQRDREAREQEGQTAAAAAQRFEGILASLGTLFPRSEIEHLDQGAFVLPYFAIRVFTRNPLVRARQPDLELLSAGDVLCPIVVLHGILDDLLASLDAWPLSKVVGREDLGERFALLREEWHAADAHLFEPYLDEVRDWSRELSDDPRIARRFRESPRARAMEERVNRLRGRAIRGWGHVVGGYGEEGLRLHEAAAVLAELLTGIGTTLDRTKLGQGDPASQYLADGLAASRIVDYAGRSRIGSPDYKPVIRQLRRWVEARYRSPVEAMPLAAQLEYLELFRGVAELYAYLLNDHGSFLVRAGHALVLAGSEEAERWRREKRDRERDALVLLEDRLREDASVRSVDGLTHLRSREFFLAELPSRLERLRVRQRPVSALMLGVDHLRRVSEEHGRAAGDELLAATARAVLDVVREGDLAIRYGAEEILLVVPSELSAATALAERLRSAQERAVGAEASFAAARQTAAVHGEPCGTLSVGVAEAAGDYDAGALAGRAGRALAVARQRLNAVVFLDPARGDEPTVREARCAPGEEVDTGHPPA